MNDEVKVVTPKEAEKADIIICRLKVDFERVPDISVTDTCSKCGEDVIIRKDAPKKPKRVCMKCMTTMPEMKDSEAMVSETASPEFVKFVEEFTRQFKTKH